MKKISFDSFKMITRKYFINEFMVCQVCSGEYETREKMYESYSIVTMDMFTCPKCKFRYSSGSYKNRKNLLFIGDDIVELVG